MGLMEYIYIYRTSLTGDSKPTNILLRLTRLIVGDTG